MFHLKSAKIHFVTSQKKRGRKQIFWNPFSWTSPVWPWTHIFATELWYLYYCFSDSQEAGPTPRRGWHKECSQGLRGLHPMLQESRSNGPPPECRPKMTSPRPGWHKDVRRGCEVSVCEVWMFFLSKDVFLVRRSRSFSRCCSMQLGF